MTHRNQFVLRNESSKALTLNIEPEGAHFALRKREEVSVTDDFTAVPVTLKLSELEGAVTVVSVWPGDGDVSVRKDGIDILDLVHDEVTA